MWTADWYIFQWRKEMQNDGTVNRSTLKLLQIHDDQNYQNERSNVSSSTYSQAEYIAAKKVIQHITATWGEGLQNAQ